jgi:hypothetical protein
LKRSSTVKKVVDKQENEDAKTMDAMKQIFQVSQDLIILFDLEKELGIEEETRK